MSSYVTKKTPGDTSWFIHDRFGMFIHFGIFAMPARHEWIKCYELISEEKYDKYFKYFNPDLYDARHWAQMAKKAGIKYAVLTTKHHDGFCLFESKYTDYTVMNTPYGKDIVKEYVDAFKEAGLKVGLYYSLLDWHHPDFVIDLFHPRRYEENACEENKKRNMKKYAEYMRNQVTELLTNYGKIDILWFDFSYPDDPKPSTNLLNQHFWPRSWMKGKGKDDWESEKLIETIRAIQPDIIINNRTGIDQDIWTPEQTTPTEWIKHPKTNELVVWESCETMVGGSWGYNRDDTFWRPSSMLIQMLINNVSCGGNMLLNVGPTARGCFDERAEQILADFEKWMKHHGRSIYNCTMAEPEFKAPRGCRYTQSTDGKRLYLHIIEYPNGNLELENLSDKIDYAQFLHDSSEIFFSNQKTIQNGDTITEDKGKCILKVPKLRPDVAVPVIEMFLK
ncbi:MAG: alpha-L-fucosidase [Clostridia bacterium]|nr:alpha-L-fucosidase [Clostridia bacterium]